jgi:hypothetical protein
MTKEEFAAMRRKAQMSRGGAKGGKAAKALMQERAKHDPEAAVFIRPVLREDQQEKKGGY